MKKSIKYVLLFLLACALIVALASCAAPPSCPPHADTDQNGACDNCGEVIDPQPTPEKVPDLSNIKFENISVSYDGKAHSISITGQLPEGVSVRYEGNDKVDVGMYQVSARFYYKGAEIQSSALTATLTIIKSNADMSGVHLRSLSKIYDGIEVHPQLAGELPIGVSASFTIKNSLGEIVNKIIDVGTYTVYATFTGNNNYYPIEPISATVRIDAPSVDEVRLDDLTVAYDGKPHRILLKGEIPAGVTVVYTGNDKVAVGEYDVVAAFYIGGVELEEKRLTATLTITKATVDMSGVSAPDLSGVYNGAPHAPTLAGNLPSEVKPVYTFRDSLGASVGEIVSVGVYQVTVSFEYDEECYNTVSPMVFTYTVKKAELDTSLLAPTSLAKTYDGAAAQPSLVGTLPEGVGVKLTYKNSLGNIVDEILNVGEYTVVASFVYDGANYEDIEPITFVYTVTKASYDLSGVTFGSYEKVYDAKVYNPSYGTLPSGLGAVLTIKNSLGETVDEIIDAGSYKLTLSFEGDFENYYAVNDLTATVIVKRAPISGISFTDGVFNFDGKEKSIAVDGAPEWMEVVYTGNGVVAPGTYVVTARFSEHPNFLPISDMKAKIVINVDKSTPSEGILFEENGGGYAVVGVESGVSVLIIPETHLDKPVTSVKSFAFEGNDELIYVYIPTGVTNIGNKAFTDCTSLLNVEFGNIKVIGQQAFKNTALRTISLPASLESIGFGAFEGTRLERMTLPFVGGSRHTSNPYIGFIFGASTYAANSVKVPSTLSSVALANGCTAVPPRAFYGVLSLTEIVFGEDVKEIGNSAFEGCVALRDVYIPSSVAAIPGDAKPENGPFYGASEDLMIVVESIESSIAWGKYYSYIGESKQALVIYDKSYEDYYMNKESLRVADLTDASLAGIFVDGELLKGFDSSVYEYTLDRSINASVPRINAIASTSGAVVTVIPPSASTDNVAVITIVSLNGEASLKYKISFNMIGTFAPSAEVVNKNGAKGTVTFVVDDGYTPTASFMKTMMQKYSKLAVTYAIYTKNFLTAASEEYKTDNGLIIDDIDGDGLNEYVLDENGRYTYIRNEEVIDFWRDILSVGRSEIVAHSHTHAFWGVNDEGGAQLTASTADKIATRIYSSLAEGSAAKEVYASLQIVKDIFGDSSQGLTYVNAGIPPKEGDTTVTEEVSVYLAKQTVRVLFDTKVTVTDGVVRLEEQTWVNLQSTVGTLPENTSINTTQDTSSGVIPAGTPIYLSSAYVTVPTTDPDGNVNIVKGFKEYIKGIYKEAYENGTIIGGRTSGQQVYVASDFLNLENRILRKAYIIATSTNEARPDSWKKHIDNAIAANGGWASFCIHAMTEDISEEGQGGHKITWEQAEDLFSYACGKGDDLWIASQTDATMYYHQWSTSNVKTSYDAKSHTISISLTDKENDELYTMPLTIKLSVPGNWASVTVNGEELTIRQNSDGSSYVYVDVAPETTVSVLGR